MKIPNKYFPFLVFWGINLVVFLFYFFLFYPALMSPDSHDQWAQAREFRLGNWHPFLHTLYIRYLTYFWENPAIISIVQFLMMSGLFCGAFHFFWNKLPERRKLVSFLYGFYVLSIPVNLYTITVWKDIPFSIGIIGFSFLLYLIYIKEIQFKGKWIALLFVLALFATTMRHNGIIFLVFLPLVSWYALKSLVARKQLAYFLGSYLVLSLFLTKVLPHMLDVDEKPWWLSRAVIYHSMAGLVKPDPITHETPRLTQRSRDLLLRAISEENLYRYYTPQTWDYIYFHPYVDRNLMQSKEFWDPLTSDFFHVTFRRSIHLILGQRVTMFISATMGYLGRAAGHFDPAKYNLVDLQVPGKDLLRKKIRSGSGASLLVWNSLIFYLIVVFLAVHSLYRKNRAYLIFAALSLSQLPFLFFLTPAGSWRYYYFIYLAGLIAIPVYLVAGKAMKAKKA